MKKMNIPSSKKSERLYKEIRAFRLWADKYYPDRSEENDNGEWEFGVNSHFNEMLSAAILIVSETDSAEADEKLIDSLLFVVARDNESEILADELLKHKDWFELLARKSTDTQYINAQWQFAKRLASCDLCKDLVYVLLILKMNIPLEWPLRLWLRSIRKGPRNMLSDSGIEVNIRKALMRMSTRR